MPARRFTRAFPPLVPARAELAPFTGADGGSILVACDGVVFDMASHPTGVDFYGPGRGYGIFAGADATVGLATMNLKPAEWGATAYGDLTADQRSTLAGWTSKFLEKYAVVGALVAGTRPTALAELPARVEAARAAAAAAK